LKLIELNQPGATPLTAAALRADERIVNYIKGLNYLDDRLTPLLMPFDALPDLTLPSSQLQTVHEIVEHLKRAAADGNALPLVQLVGADAASKQMIAQQVAATFGLELHRLPADLIPTDFHELETLVRLWDRNIACCRWPCTLTPPKQMPTCWNVHRPRKAGSWHEWAASSSSIRRILGRSLAVRASLPTSPSPQRSNNVTCGVTG